MAPRAVTALTLTDFRNYARARLSAPAGPVVLTGPNGAGKTNILEALSLLAPGRGLRRARAGELTRRDAHHGAGWGVAATIADNAQSWEVGTGLAEPDAERPRRAVRIDGRSAGSQAELGELATILWLTPAQDGLFTGPAEDRRRFFDRLVAAGEPGHGRELAAYDQARRQRQRLLREARETGRPADPAWLAALEAQIAARGVAVAAARRRYLAELDGECAQEPGPFPAAGLAPAGTVEGWLDQVPAVTAEDWLAGALAENRPVDAAAGTATLGPHRSDVATTLRADGRPAEQGSTGEQKALLLALILAEARRHRAATGGAPILLLDEVAAHLDPDRRAELLARLAELGGQSWLTGTEARLFTAARGRATFHRVESAAIWPQEPADL